MAHVHLTDEDIQNWLDGNISRHATRMEQHSETCKTCRNRLEEYQHLYHELKKEPDFTLSTDFVRLVLSRLSPEQASLHPPKEIVLFVLGALFALGATFYLVDMRPVVNILSQITLPEVGIGTTLLIPIRNFLSDLNDNIVLLFFAGSVLLTVGILDRILSKLRQHKLPL